MGDLQCTYIPVPVTLRNDNASECCGFPASHLTWCKIRSVDDYVMLYHHMESNSERSQHNNSTILNGLV